MRHFLTPMLLIVATGAYAGDSAPTITTGPGGDPGYTELSETSLQRAVDALRDCGGRIVIGPGDYQLLAGIRIDRFSSNLEIEGKPGARLVLAPAPTTRLVTRALAGQTHLKVESNFGFPTGQYVELMSADGELVNANVHKLDGGDSIVIASGLNRDMPAGTPVMLTVNGIGLYSSRNVTIANLEIDMQRDQQPFAPRNHSRHCAIMVSAPYTHGQGARSQSRNIRIWGCTLSNAWGRGVAFYACEDCEVIGCGVDNVHEEGIDVDHYCRRIKVSQNTVSRAEKAAIEINDASDCSITANRIGNSQLGIKIWHYEPVKMKRHNQGNLFVDNHIVNCAQNTFWMGPEVNRNVIAHNSMERSGSFLLRGNANLLIDNGEVIDDGANNILHDEAPFRVWSSSRRAARGSRDPHRTTVSRGGWET